MKIVFALDNYIKYYAIDDVIRELYRRGHEIVMIMGQDKESPVPDDAFQKAKAELPNLRVEPLIKRKVLRKIVRTLRELLNYAYIINSEEKRRWDAMNWGRFFHPFTWKVITSAPGKRALKHPTIQKTLRFIEQRIPVTPEIKRHLQEHNPDIVIAMPLISGDSREGEYIQAASGLRIPTVFSMFSWDNLSTKGTFYSRPDFHLVWNEPLAQELVQLHGIPRDRIFITGAPRFDRLNGAGGGYNLPREEFCRIVGMDPGKKFILYVGSTFLLDSQFRKSLAEERLILEIADTLQKNRETSGIHVLARPHPQNAGIVPALQGANRENITVYPTSGELPDTEEKRRMFYNSIHHSIAVVGVNTTAFLEASTLDKPCITVVEEMASATQQLPHFHHLTDAGFLETAHETGELVEILTRINLGVDAKAELRRKFVVDFIRPGGRSAVETYANLVEAFGAGRILPAAATIPEFGFHSES